MKKWFFMLMLMGFVYSPLARAQEASSTVLIAPDSPSPTSIIYTSIKDVGPLPPDVIHVQAAVDSVLHIITATTSYTILGYNVYSGDPGEDGLYCGSQSLFNPSDVYTAGFSDYFVSAPAQLHCSEDFVVSTGNVLFIELWYVPYDTRQVSSRETGTLVMGEAIIITLLFLAFVGFMFNKIKARKPWLSH